MRVCTSALEVGRGEDTCGLVLCVLHSFPSLSQQFTVGWKGVQTALCALLRLLQALTCECALALCRWKGENTLVGLCAAFFIPSPAFPKVSLVGWKGVHAALCALLRLLHALTCECALALCRWKGENTLVGLCAAFFIPSPAFPKVSLVGWKGVQAALCALLRLFHALTCGRALPY